jgi:tetratricopeptide (TPR) repeat protein
VVEWIGLAWVGVSLVLLSPVAAFIGDDQFGARNHYLLPICALLPISAIAGLRPMLFRLMSRGIWLPVAVSVLVGGYYSHYQLVLYGQGLSPETAPKSEQMIEPGFAAFTHMDFDRAAVVFATILADNPGYAPAHLGEGLVLFNRGEFAEGVSAIEHAVAVFPWFIEAHMALAIFHIHLGEGEKAAEVLAGGLGVRPEFAPARLLLAQLNAHLGHEGEALAGFWRYREQVVVLRQGVIDALYDLAERHQAVDVLPKILGDLNIAVSGPRESMMDDRLYGLLYKHLDDKGFNAIGGQGTDIIRPYHDFIYYNMGNLLLATGELSAAIGEYESALGLAPGHAWIMNNLGVANARNGDLAAAETRWSGLLARGAAMAEAHNNLGCFYTQRQQLDEARLHFVRAGAAEDPVSIPGRNLAGLRAGEVLDNRPCVYMLKPNIFKWPQIVTEEIEHRLHSRVPGQ